MAPSHHRFSVVSPTLTNWRWQAAREGAREDTRGEREGLMRRRWTKLDSFHWTLVQMHFCQTFQQFGKVSYVILHLMGAAHTSVDSVNTNGTLTVSAIILNHGLNLFPYWHTLFYMSVIRHLLFKPTLGGHSCNRSFLNGHWILIILRTSRQDAIFFSVRCGQK